MLETGYQYLEAYSGVIPPLAGERHWPKANIPLLPPPFKLGPSRPKKNRIKSSHEDPKKQGKLTRYGVQITCKICGVVGHNKRKRPDKDTMTEAPPPPKRGKGRPRKSVVDATPQQTLVHHDISAQPSQLGRGNKRLRGGQGSRGSGRGASRRTATVRGSATISGGVTKVCMYSI